MCTESQILIHDEAAVGLNRRRERTIWSFAVKGKVGRVAEMDRYDT